MISSNITKSIDENPKFDNPSEQSNYNDLIINLSGIEKKYPDGNNNFNYVLRGLNLEVTKGDFISVKGVSGSGKTTLLSILGTLIKPDSGVYILNQKNMLIPDIDYSEIRNKILGFVFQDHKLLPQFCVLDNILLPTLATASKSTAEQEKYAYELMEITGISGISKQYPSTISGGEASRVAVCRALIMKPLLILADEPTGQLDAENAKIIASLLSELNKIFNITIIMVTHSDEVSAIAKRTLILKNGVLI